jgi:hypothetical protein
MKSLYDVSRQLLFGIDQYNPNIQMLLKLYGFYPIIDIKIYRQPIQTFLKKTLNILSFGLFEKNVKSNYDNVYHLYMVVTLSNGKFIKIEKNQRINIQRINPINDPIENIRVDIKDKININYLLDNTKIQMKDNYFIYTTDKYNCQNFILNILSSNNLLNEKLYNFIYQDPKILFNKLDNLSYIGNVLSNIAAKGDVIIKGGDI